jgi:hypothetical protein
MLKQIQKLNKNAYIICVDYKNIYNKHKIEESDCQAPELTGKSFKREEINTAIIREIQEELYLNVIDDTKYQMTNYNNISYTNINIKNLDIYDKSLYCDIYNQDSKNRISAIIYGDFNDFTDKLLFSINKDKCDNIISVYIIPIESVITLYEKSIEFLNYLKYEKIHKQYFIGFYNFKQQKYSNRVKYLKNKNEFITII